MMPEHLKIAVLTDHPDLIDTTKSASWLMIREAIVRGYEVYQYQAESVVVKHDDITASLLKIDLQHGEEKPYTLNEPQRLSLADFDIIIMRQDPPVNMEYISQTYFQDLLKNRGVFITNDPAATRGMSEKLSIFNFSEHIAPTLVTKDVNAIKNFFKQYGDIIVKPLYLYSAKDIVRARSFDEISKLVAQCSEPLMFQKFIPDIIEGGNKRIILFDGEVVGALKNVPQDGEFRVYQNSIDHPYTPNNAELSLCKEIGKYAKETGAHFVGVDLIGDYLTEINVTSVGSLYRMNQVYGIQIEEKFWDMIESKYKDFKNS